MTTPTPEERADSLVVVGPLTPGGPPFIQLQGPAELVHFGPYENPDLAKKEAEKLRRFLAAVIRDADGSASAPR